ncbi:MAG: RNA pseudouridine synthase [Thermoanaerobaculum sp.]|nr:RNA pseudouridine synthase [Thermoanaerobaculum sp.]
MSVLLWVTPELLACNKPPGFSVATGKRHGLPVEERLRPLIAAEDPACASGPLFLVHRLDVGTSGVLLVARSARMHRQLAQALARGEIHRQYLALVWGKPRPQEGVWEVPLAPDPKDRRKMCPHPGGKRAVTWYRRLGFRPPVSLVLLTPHTGRTHQLRVHLASAGHPIVGDDLYGGPRHHGVNDPQGRAVLAPPHPLLHAWRVQLPGELSPEPVQAPLPPAFARALATLGLAEAVHHLSVLPPMPGRRNQRGA